MEEVSGEVKVIKSRSKDAKHIVCQRCREIGVCVKNGHREITIISESGEPEKHRIPRYLCTRCRKTFDDAAVLSNLRRRDKRDTDRKVVYRIILHLYIEGHKRQEIKNILTEKQKIVSQRRTLIDMNTAVDDFFIAMRKKTPGRFLRSIRRRGDIIDCDTDRNPSTKSKNKCEYSLFLNEKSDYLVAEFNLKDIPSATKWKAMNEVRNHENMPRVDPEKKKADTNVPAKKKKVKKKVTEKGKTAV